MKLLSYLILTLILLSAGAPAVVAQEAVDPWGDEVAPGIEYREYRSATLQECTGHHYPQDAHQCDIRSDWHRLDDGADCMYSDFYGG